MLSINSDTQSISRLSQSQKNLTNSSEQPSEQNTAPLVSFGLPVYEVKQDIKEEYFRQLLDSLLTQDLQDIEVVISDNASNDGTQEICEEYANRDSRIRYHRNPENIGQIDNFNKVLELAQGKYFRWIGSDDWLEPDYARQCVEVLEAENRKDFVGVTTYYDFSFNNGQSYYREYQGEYLDSPLPYVRFRRMVWFMTADFGFIDPIYTMMRRELLLKTRLLQHIKSMDQVLAVELSLLGSFAHVPACLAHRRWKDFGKISKEKLWERFSPKEHQNLDKSNFYVAKVFLSTAWIAPISNWQKLLCLWPVVRFTAIRTWGQYYPKLRSLASPLKSLLRSSKKDK
ncbi:MAG: glycosyltransferase family 2 protein [Symploca sp. SIO2G7]|nr:glycosyltransferase family 2 protein [Symploca sp. SIO2G7]